MTEYVPSSVEVEGAASNLLPSFEDRGAKTLQSITMIPGLPDGSVRPLTSSANGKGQGYWSSASPFSMPGPHNIYIDARQQFVSLPLSELISSPTSIAQVDADEIATIRQTESTVVALAAVLRLIGSMLIIVMVATVFGNAASGGIVMHPLLIGVVGISGATFLAMGWASN